MELIKLRKEIREAHKEEGYQGNDLKVKLEEMIKEHKEEKRQDE